MLPLTCPLRGGVKLRKLAWCGNAAVSEKWTKKALTFQCRKMKKKFACFRLCWGKLPSGSSEWAEGSFQSVPLGSFFVPCSSSTDGKSVFEPCDFCSLTNSTRQDKEKCPWTRAVQLWQESHRTLFFPPTVPSLPCPPLPPMLFLHQHQHELLFLQKMVQRLYKEWNSRESKMELT